MCMIYQYNCVLSSNVNAQTYKRITKRVKNVNEIFVILYSLTYIMIMKYQVRMKSSRVK